MVRNTNPGGKFKELILFICQRSLADRKFGATKLNKLLFFADFAAYLKLGHSITGAEYIRREYGAVPKQIVTVLAEMEASGDLAQTTHDYYGKTQIRSVARRDPDLSDFTADEIAVVTEMLAEYKDRNATEVSLISPEFDGWKLAREGETIPYQVALAEPVPMRDSDRVISDEFAEMLREWPFFANVVNDTEMVLAKVDLGIGEQRVIAVVHAQVRGDGAEPRLDQPRQLGPLASTSVVIEESDAAGGLGANFIVEWHAAQPVNAPIVESIMISARSSLGISFTSPARVLEER